MDTIGPLVDSRGFLLSQGRRGTYGFSPHGSGRQASRTTRAALHTRHYSRRTKEAYVGWIRRYIFSHGKRHPAEMGADMGLTRCRCDKEATTASSYGRWSQSRRAPLR
jgi:hypothetical protein